jgi:hypothetical protein
MRHLRVPLSCPKFFRVHYITGQMEYNIMFITATQNRISFGALASFYRSFLWRICIGLLAMCFWIINGLCLYILCSFFSVFPFGTYSIFFSSL